MHVHAAIWLLCSMFFGLISEGHNSDTTQQRASAKSSTTARIPYCRQCRYYYLPSRAPLGRLGNVGGLSEPWRVWGSLWRVSAVPGKLLPVDRTCLAPIKSEIQLQRQFIEKSKACGGDFEWISGKRWDPSRLWKPPYVVLMKCGGNAERTKRCLSCSRRCKTQNQTKTLSSENFFFQISEYLYITFVHTMYM
jgi:hypothetical protein